MKIDSWLKVILDSLYDGVLITDEKSIVKYINPSYTRITGVEPESILEKHLELIRPGSMLPEVIKTGKKILGKRRKVGPSEYIVNIVPVMENHHIAGAISILNEINDMYKLAGELVKSNRLIKNLKERVKKLGNAKYCFDDIICHDDKSKDTIRLAKKIAGMDMNVLITGQSGTGKELYAQAIHNASARSEYPFIAVNCATLESNLLESELFGYEEGSFTGAKKGGKAGLFEEANGGTIFLDEISEMDVKLQAKLLRVLQENVIRPVGGVYEVSVDVRVIAATNRKLEELADQNFFRQDLYYRLAVFTLNIVPLRDRREDILPIAQKYLGDFNDKYKRNISISGDSLELLYSYDWPGNVRELRNIIEYASMMTDDDAIKPEDLPKRMQKVTIDRKVVELKPLSEAVKLAEAVEIKKALMKFGDSVEGKKRAAEALGISLASLYNKLK